ncbi:hypothetical protein [Silvanigrella sp.]|uniref:hypothetical protein n=1 Tax=Silvanigrella sp. TaxID=2024976 RepID=UPI0037C9C59A
MKKTLSFILLALNLISLNSFASGEYKKCKYKIIKICSIYQPPPYLPVHSSPLFIKMGEK